MTKEERSFFCSGQMRRMIFDGMEEVMGPAGLEAVLAQAGMTKLVQPQEEKISFRNISLLQAALEEQYGILGGHGLALRSGRASFKYGMKEFDHSLGIAELSFRLMPLHTRIKTGVHAMAHTLNRMGDFHVSIESAGTKILWKIENCPVCWKRHAAAPVCHHTIGFLQEFLNTISSGRNYPVTETECIAANSPACKFVIDTQAIE